MCKRASDRDPLLICSRVLLVTPGLPLERRGVEGHCFDGVKCYRIETMDWYIKLVFCPSAGLRNTLSDSGECNMCFRLYRLAEPCVLQKSFVIICSYAGCSDGLCCPTALPDTSTAPHLRLRLQTDQCAHAVCFQAKRKVVRCYPALPAGQSIARF